MTTALERVELCEDARERSVAHCALVSRVRLLHERFETVDAVEEVALVVVLQTLSVGYRGTERVRC